MDKLTKARRSFNMSRIRSKNTIPEILVRKALSILGYRYRINYKICGHPDIAFPKARIAVFIHGCFWHRHRCKNSVIPKTNRRFWQEKLESNVKHDKKVIKTLKTDKWFTIIIWECEIENNIHKVIFRLNRFLKKKIAANK